VSFRKKKKRDQSTRIIAHDVLPIYVQDVNNALLGRRIETNQILQFYHELKIEEENGGTWGNDMFCVT
jgi:hypothetical protein